MVHQLPQVAYIYIRHSDRVIRRKADVLRICEMGRTSAAFYDLKDHCLMVKLNCWNLARPNTIKTPGIVLLQKRFAQI